MANDLGQIAPQLLAQGMLALRGACVMPRLVNTDFSNVAAQRGAYIEVPIPSAITAQAVSPSATAPATADISPTTATIRLDQWWEAPFYLTDKDVLTVERGFLPVQASEAIKAIADKVNGSLLALGRKFYGLVGTPGVTPFATVADATGARKILNRQLAPLADRRIVLDPDAEAAALALSGFADASRTGDTAPAIEGTLGRKYGFDWAMDQQVPRFEASIPSPGDMLANGVNAAGSMSLSIAKANTGFTLREGDILAIDGDDQTYVVTADTPLAAGNTSVPVYPPLVRATEGGEDIYVADSHVMNLAFHRDAIAFACRPLLDSSDGLGNVLLAAADAASGLALRLEIAREHKRTRYSFDILYGCDVVRRELGCRIAG